MEAGSWIPGHLYQWDPTESRGHTNWRESAASTAVRETYEESGYRAQAGEVSQFHVEHGIHVYVYTYIYTHTWALLSMPFLCCLGQRLLLVQTTHVFASVQFCIFCRFAKPG